MRDNHGYRSVTGEGYGDQVREALDRLRALIVDGVKHGFFDYSISCEVSNKGRRKLVVRLARATSSRSPRSTCRAEAVDGGDPWDGDAQDANRLTIQGYRRDSESGDQGHGAATSWQ